MKKCLGQVFLLLVLIAMGSVAAPAQKSSNNAFECREYWSRGDRLKNHCEIREQVRAAAEIVSVDAGQNGGISVKGSDRNDILVRSRIQTAAPTQEQAEALAKQINVETGGAQIKAVGPAQEHDASWSVSYEILVPRHSNLSLGAHNGGISINDVNGRIDFNGLNGGVVLRRVGGTVHGSTTNGGLIVELAGNRWEGEEMDVKTTNGGVVISLPENYSAHLETGTVNGSVNTDFPITVQGRLTKEISLNVGSGGATVRAMTTNGGVHLKRSNAE